MAVFLIFAAFILADLAGLLYLVTRMRKFFKDSIKSKKKAYILSALPVSLLVIYTVADVVNGVIVSVNIVAIWLLAELIAYIIKKAYGRSSKFYYTGICAIIFSLIYLGTGWYFAHHVVETDYALETKKNIGKEGLRVLQISDSHVGATFDGDGFAKHMKEIQKTSPDLLVITGDYVDDDTTREDMVKCCEALGKFKAKYGKYFIFGNHDRGYFNSRNFDEKDLCDELEKNDVKVLVDEVADIGENIVVVGRDDRSSPSRKNMKSILKGIDREKYIIVLDHQPHDFDAQAKEKVDLVLCGHTHGGQMFPVGLLGEWSGANDKTYGLEKRGQTNFIVNSGISDWAIDYKTGGAISEYGVIDIKKQ